MKERSTDEKEFVQTGYRIPIEEFEINKSNEEEILNILKKPNCLTSDQYKKVQAELRSAVKKGDKEWIEILLDEEINNGEMIFKINRTRGTASLFFMISQSDTVVVPRSIEHQGKSYVITSIAGTSKSFMYVKNLLFDEESEIRTIYPKSFHSSQIMHFCIPPQLNELKSGWCAFMKYLTKIEVSPKNKNFIVKDEQLLLGKSDQKSDNFDVLLFAVRNISKAIIPSNIKIISSCSFSYCSCLVAVEIQPNSELTIIEDRAFLSTKIKKIFIPPHVSKICEKAFGFCKNLENVEIPANSELKSIEEGAFSSAGIKEIFIPPQLNELGNEWYSYEDKLTKIEVSPKNKNFILKDEQLLLGKSDPKSDNFDVLVLAVRNISKAIIPPNIKIISSFSFDKCFNLKTIEIPMNSELQLIECHAFSCTKIKKIFIPPHVSRICKSAFYSCDDLEIVEIPENSELQLIEESAFSSTKIKEIFIPPQLNELKSEWCEFMNYLTKIEVSPKNKNFIVKDEQLLLGKSDPKSDNFDVLILAVRNISKAIIPSNIKIISSYSFDKCLNLKTIEIPMNSELQLIECHAFSYTTIKKIIIPPHVSKICKNSFYSCDDLEIIEISENSALTSIELYNSHLKFVMIPSNMRQLIPIHKK